MFFIVKKKIQPQPHFDLKPRLNLKKIKKKTCDFYFLEVSKFKSFKAHHDSGSHLDHH